MNGDGHCGRGGLPEAGCCGGGDHSGGMDRVVMVDDDEVRDAMRAYFVDTHNVAEGAGAVGLAGLLKDRANGGQRVATVLTGGNVNSEVFGEVLCESRVSSLA